MTQEWYRIYLEMISVLEAASKVIVGSKHCKAYSAAASSELSELVVHVDVVYFG